ncbi:uncharacterized protein isoform X3 [Bombus fervidus]|uniref:uncharacterized protein isoform X3 n=1 Tax=Bombus fervidus TaxID=203811 RepID=UPI003D18E356
MFIDCMPWLSCLTCNVASPETPKIYGLSFKKTDCLSKTIVFPRHKINLNQKDTRESS